jgi:predicted nucleotidyltransferase
MDNSGNDLERIKTINREVFDFITGFKELLLSNCGKITGIYVFGSLAYGGFNEGRSDIDIVVITKTLLKNSDLDRLKNIHKELSAGNEKWSKRLEVSYTPEAMLKEKNPPKTPRPYYNGFFYDEASYGNEWLINNYLLCHYGITLYGPEYKTLIQKPIKIEEIRDACIKDFYAEWLPKLHDREWLSNSHYQSYMILNICRILYTIINLETANKQIAAHWVQEQYTEWNDLIDEAEKWNYRTTMNKEKEAKEFIRFALKTIRRTLK